MVRRRRISLVALGAALALVAAACGNDDDVTADDDTAAAPADGDVDEAAGEGSIWVLLPDAVGADRWVLDDPRFFQQAFEDAGLTAGDDFTIVNATDDDPITQQSQAEQAIAAGASVIVIASLDPGSGGTIIAQAQAEDVAVVEYDRFNTGGPGGDAYVSFDNVQVGATMAEILEPEIDALDVDDGAPNVVMLNGGEEDNNSFLFRDGYNETVEARVEAGDWELVADQHVPGWDNQQAQTIMEQILVEADNDVDAVFAANDGLANAAGNAIAAAGLDPVPISGQDAAPAGIQNILLGNQTMTTYKPIEDEASVAAAVAMALRAGEDVLEVESPFDFSLIGIEADTGQPTPEPGDDVTYFALTPIGVTADNVDETVIADGFRTVEEICEGDVAETDFCQEQG